MSTQTTQPSAQVEMVLNRHCPLVTCGQDVKRGERIATGSLSDKGDIHTPIPGKVVHVDPYRIRIDQTEGDSVKPVPLDGLAGKDLLARLREMGADLPACDDVDTLIFNGADAEQGIVTRHALLETCSTTLETGAKTLTEAYHPETTTLVVLNNSPAGLIGVTSTAISEQYPSGLDPLVAKAVTGTEAPENTLVIGLETLFHVGRIIETGIPALETMITVGDKGEIVSLGTPVGEILEMVGETIQDRDRIILGGPMRGNAAASPKQGVDRTTYAVAVVRNPTPIAKDTACVGCGECVRRCPARLDPAMITSYAEFGMYDKAATEHVQACFECGLCGFFCIARRPMLQYIRLAKNELAQAAKLSGEEN